MRKHSPLRLVRDSDADTEDAAPVEERQGKPLSVRMSLVIWGVMAVLAWGVVALALHLLR